MSVLQVVPFLANWSFTSVKVLGRTPLQQSDRGGSIRMFSSMLVQKIMVA